MGEGKPPESSPAQGCLLLPRAPAGDPGLGHERIPAWVLDRDILGSGLRRGDLDVAVGLRAGRAGGAVHPV